MIFSDIVHELFSDVRTLNMPIVEGPIEHHKSRLVSRETGDGLTVTYSGGNLDRTETVPKMAARAPCACRPEGSLSTRQIHALVES